MLKDILRNLKVEITYFQKKCLSIPYLQKVHQLIKIESIHAISITHNEPYNTP
ncbi:hypothetical protein BVRB_6g135810 [Beta vulgaris subsp. vulgaris]|nr:hypothetical protein BVRB_6g135810 [Beta vulgaris subsp. vulgaris]